MDNQKEIKRSLCAIALASVLLTLPKAKAYDMSTDTDVSANNTVSISQSSNYNYEQHIKEILASTAVGMYAGLLIFLLFNGLGNSKTIKETENRKYTEELEKLLYASSDYCVPEEITAVKTLKKTKFEFKGVEKIENQKI